MVSMMLLGLAGGLAHAAEVPHREALSPALRVVTGVGITTGAAGLGSLGLALASLRSPEPHGLFVFGTAGVVLLGTGSVMAGASSWGQAARIGAEPGLALGGVAVAGAGLVLGSLGLASDNTQWQRAAAYGMPLAGAVGLGMIAAQGLTNLRLARGLQLAVVPRLGRQWGVTVAARW